MKTIILCGGQGTRLREETEFKPKPMVVIGGQPMLLHIMNIYAQASFKEFVLCLGYKGEMIREYFLHLATFGNDIELDLATNEISFLRKHVALDYKVALIETGLETSSGGRVLQAAHLITDKQFMVTYGDGVGDLDIAALLKRHNLLVKKKKVVATVTLAHPNSKYGQVMFDKKNTARAFDEKPRLHDYINGGFMVFEKAALKYLRPNESLEEGLTRMTTKGVLGVYQHEGFWHGMDTMKDVLELNALWKEKHSWRA